MAGVPPFGAALRQARAGQGMSLAELARLVHYSPGYLSRVERGERPPTAVLARSCDEELATGGRLARLVTRRPPARAATLPRPAQLPAVLAGFTGRAAELEALTRLLDEGSDPDSTAGPVVISAIGGVAGIGKTTFAVRWAHQVTHRFPDGQLFVNLRGFGPDGSPVAPEQAVRGFLDAFEVPPGKIPASLDAQASLYRSLLAGRRVLIIADNARDEAQVRPLLPGSPGCLLLVTSRKRLTGLIAADGARPLTLDLLTGEEAIRLLSHRIGAARVAAEPQAAEQIAGSCGRLPLALSVVAARAAANPDFPLAVLAGELGGTTGGRLDALDGGEPAIDVRTVFSWSYQQLDPQPARLFRLIGLHPGPDIGVAAAASLAGLPARQARRILAALVGMHLISEHIPGRFALHDLLREFASELTHTLDSPPERSAAAHRMLDHYLRTAHAATLLLDAQPIHGPIALPLPNGGATPEQIADATAARVWFDAERLVLLALIAQAAATGWNTHAWQLAWALRDNLASRGYFHDLLASQRTALEAARQQGDRQGQARAHSGIGSALGWLGDHREASRHLCSALDLFGELQDIAGQATMHLDLGWILSNQGRNAAALDRAHQALALYCAVGDRIGQATTLGNIGWSYAELGDHHKAVSYCQGALTLHRELGDRRSEARTLDHLGYALHHLGLRHRAVTCYQRSVTMSHEHGDSFYEASALDHLGDTHHAAGELAAARASWQQAFTILDQIGHARAIPIRQKLLDVDQADWDQPAEDGPT